MSYLYSLQCKSVFKNQLSNRWVVYSERPSRAVPSPPQPPDCRSWWGTQSRAAAETKRASLPCQAQHPSDVMRNVTEWQTGPGEISKYDHPSIQKRGVRTGAGQWEGEPPLYKEWRFRPQIEIAMAPGTCNHADFIWIAIHTDTVLETWLCGITKNRKPNGRTVFVLHFYCIGPFKYAFLHTIQYCFRVRIKAIATCG